MSRNSPAPSEPIPASLSGTALAAVSMLIAAAAITVVDGVLLQRKFGVFTGGFLQGQAPTTWDRIAFVVMSVPLDLAAVAPFVLAVFLLARRWPRLGAMQRVFVAASLGLAPLAIATFARLQVVRYFGDKIEYSTLRMIGAGSVLEMLAQASAHVLSFGILFAGCVVALAIGAKLAGLVDRRLFPGGSTYRWRTAPAVIGTIFAVALGPAIVLGTSFTDADLYRRLARKVSGQWAAAAAAQATDFDGDGYGMVGQPVDFAPLDPLRYPYAIDWPGNGIDENGIGGDLLSAPGLPVASNAPIVRRPDIVLIGLETYRYDNVGAEVGGVEVTPVINGLIADGAAFAPGYSHSGFSRPSLISLFQGASSEYAAGNLVEDLAAAGYTTAVVSGHDDSFGDINLRGGTREADYYIDARDDADKRTSPFTTPGSLGVPWEVVVGNVAEVLDQAPRERPLFLYVFLGDAHFPYDSYGLRRLIDVDPIPRSEITPENADWVMRTYRNAAANVDHAVGEVLDTVRRARGIDPAFLMIGDHGESLFDDGVLGHGFQLSDNQLRVPVVTRGLVSRMRAPVGISEVRGIVNAALREPEPKKTEVVNDPEKRVYLYVPDMETPNYIGVAGPSWLAWMDVREGTYHQSGTVPPALNDPSAYLQVWEQRRLALALGARNDRAPLARPGR